MESTVVSVVISIGLSLVAPASTSAVSTSISSLYWFTVSIYRIPLLTTVPTSIKSPTMAVILILTPLKYKSPKAPINENGIVNITINENLGDSNCIAITINIRNIAVKSALSKELISLPSILV